MTNCLLSSRSGVALLTYFSLNAHYRLLVHKIKHMRIWRNWQTRMVQVAPLRCKFISASISCKLWIKHFTPPRFSTLNRVKIQREKLNMHPWRNWQTRMVQVHIFERKCRFNSCRVHQLLKGIYKGILFSYAEVYNG